MPAAKKAKPALKTKSSLSGNNRRLVIILAAFAAVGVALLIRSFASTVVLSANYATSFSGGDANLTAISSGGKKSAVVTEPDGKKTVNYLETGQDGVSYGFKLAPGFYQACVNAKPITAGAKAEVRSVLVGSTTAQPITVTATEDGGKTHRLNSFKEICVNLISRDQTQTLAAIFAPLSGTWRLSNLTVRTLNQDTQTIDLNSAFLSKDPRFTFTGVSSFYDSVRGKNILKVEPYGRITFNVTEVGKPLVSAQASVKAASADAILTMGIMRNQKGGESETPVTPDTGSSYNTLNTARYTIVSYGGGALDATNVTPSNPMKFILGSNKGTVYADQLYFFSAEYGSN